MKCNFNFIVYLESKMEQPVMGMHFFTLILLEDAFL